MEVNVTKCTMLFRGSASVVSLIKKVLYTFPRGKVIHHARLKPSTLQCKQLMRLGGTVYGHDSHTQYRIARRYLQ